MAYGNAKDFLDELLYDIKKKDLIKGGIVLSSLQEVDTETQRRALFALSRADDDYVIPLLAQVIAKNPGLDESLPQVRETMFSKVLDSPKVLLALLEKGGDTRYGKLLAEITGEIRLQKAVPILLKMLLELRDHETLEAVILALGMIGDPSACRAISEYLYCGNERLIAASIRSLGQLGTPTAVKMLAERVDGRDMDTDLKILDVFGKIQSTEALEKLNETLSSHHTHLRAAAKKKLVEVGVKAVPVLLRNLLHNDPDLLIHSLNVIGDIGDEAAVPAIRKLLHNEPKNSNVRFAAYEALGLLPLQKGAFTLAAGLEDPVGNVRAAAAKAIDRNYDMVLAAGMKNMIRDGGEEATNIVLTILDSQCDTIFLSLLQEVFFQEPAMEYLTKKVHPDVRSHFRDLLEQNGFDVLAKQMQREEEPKIEAKLKVFAVDDSRMILNIYRGILHSLGHDPQLFQFPADALEEVRKEKPDVILTDLNMPDISGIQLAKDVRQRFSKDDLPIIMVTTQNETQDNEDAIAAGVNAILYKPFTEEQIQKVLEEHIGI
jgi:CheY-like chemotaxis protein